MVFCCCLGCTVRHGVLALTYAGESRVAGGLADVVEVRSAASALHGRRSLGWGFTGEEMELLILHWRGRLPVGELRGKYDPGGHFCFRCHRYEGHLHWFLQCDILEQFWSWITSWWRDRVGFALELSVDDICLLKESDVGSVELRFVRRHL